MEHSGQCCFCLDPVKCTNGITVSNWEDMKISQDIFECNKMYLKDQVIRDTFDWSNSEGFLSPFCTKCFKSAEVIHGVSKKLEEIQERLKLLVETFRCEVKLRTTKNLKVKSVCDLIKEEDNDGFIEEENIKVEFIPEHDQEDDISEFILGNISSSDEDELFMSDYSEPTECIDNDGDGKLTNSNWNGTDNSSVLDQQKSTRITTTVSNLHKITYYTTSYDISNNVGYSDRIESNINKAPYFVVVRFNGVFVCDICGRPYEYQQNLIEHRASHYGEHEKPLKCVTCGKCFISQTKLHVVIQENMALKCQICEMRFQDGESLKTHILKLHRIDLPFNCLKCEERKIMSLKGRIKEIEINPYDRSSENFKSKQGVENHKILVHREQELCNCLVCGKQFSRQDLKKHEATHRTPVKCLICKKAFESIFTLEAHNLARHEYNQYLAPGHDTTNMESVRKVYGKLCKNDTSLKRHVYETHKRQKSYLCEICGLMFEEHRLRRHIRVIDEKIFKFQCTICGKSLGDITGLKQHEKKHKDLSERQKFKCDICGEKYFVTSCGLYAHQKQLHTVFTHNYNEEFVCDICGKKIFSYSYFKKHLLAHSEMSFSCDLCGLTFKRKNSLNLHKFLHTGKKPHKCTVCAKTFAKLQHLKAHVKIHTGEKTYSCSICGRTFSDRSTWYKHKNRHKEKK